MVTSINTHAYKASLPLSWGCDSLRRCVWSWSSVDGWCWSLRRRWGNVLGRLSSSCSRRSCCHSFIHSFYSLILWRQLLPYRYSYKSSCARPG